MEIYEVTEIELDKIIGRYCQGKCDDEDIGLYLYQNESGKWIAVDNSDGNCWCDEFNRRNIAEKWLRGEIDTDEVRSIDEGGHHEDD